MISRSVLIVDDSAVSRIILRKYLLLIKPCWMCIEVHNGEDALAVARDMRFDLAIVDINMPGIGGLDTACSLKLVQPNLMISILTADSREIVKDCADNLTIHFFEKPITKAKAKAIVALLNVEEDDLPDAI